MAKGKRGPTTKAKKKETEATNGTEQPGPGHNSIPELTDDQRFALTAMHKKVIARIMVAQQELANDLRNAKKLAKSELGPYAIDDIKDMIALETEEGEAKHKAEVERRVKVARWMGLPVGTQGSIFEAVDREPAEDKAYHLGKRHGLAGDTQQNPHSPGAPQYQRYLDGFHDGNAVLAQGIRPFPKEKDEDELDALDPADNPPEPTLATVQ